MQLFTFSGWGNPGGDLPLLIFDIRPAGNIFFPGQFITTQPPVVSEHMAAKLVQGQENYTI